MANVYEKVKSILNNNSKEINYRILVLSDGIIAEQNETMNEQKKLRILLRIIIILYQSVQLDIIQALASLIQEQFHQY